MNRAVTLAGLVFFFSFSAYSLVAFQDTLDEKTPIVSLGEDANLDPAHITYLDGENASINGSDAADEFSSAPACAKNSATAVDAAM